MKIGEAAKETGLSVSNIRFYEKKGLLSPRRREDSQYREYAPEDVRHLKEIMLLRKTGLSVESIYLMYEGQAEFSGLLQRQEQELTDQMEELKGALELCRSLQKEDTLSELDVDAWLNYVHREENNGKRFACAEELLEDLGEFSGLSSFFGDPYLGRFFRHRWTAGLLAVLWLLLILAVAVFSSAQGTGMMGHAVVLLWVLVLFCLTADYIRFIRRKHRKEEAG